MRRAYASQDPDTVRRATVPRARADPPREPRRREGHADREANDAQPGPRTPARGVLRLAVDSGFNVVMPRSSRSQTCLSWPAGPGQLGTDLRLQDETGIGMIRVILAAPPRTPWHSLADTSGSCSSSSSGPRMDLVFDRQRGDLRQSAIARPIMVTHRTTRSDRTVPRCDSRVSSSRVPWWSAGRSAMSGDPRGRGWPAAGPWTRSAVIALVNGGRDDFDA